MDRAHHVQGALGPVRGGHQERRRLGLLAKLDLQQREAVDVKQQGLGAELRLDVEGAGDQREHRRRVRVDKRRRRPGEQPIERDGLLFLDLALDGVLDPGGGALEGERAVVELVLELAALVVDAVVRDDRRDQAKARVGSVDAHGVDPVQEKLERLAEDARPWLLVHGLGDELPLGLGLVVALRRLDALDDADDRSNELAAAVPGEEPVVGLVLDVVHVHHIVEVAARAGEVVDAVADLAQDAQDAHVARLRELQVVDEAVPERLVERLADAVEDGVLDAAAA